MVDESRDSLLPLDELASLAPPLQPGYISHIDAGAPISQGFVVTSFDSAASCEGERISDCKRFQFF
jgi:hypothetical protein